MSTELRLLDSEAGRRNGPTEDAVVGGCCRRFLSSCDGFVLKFSKSWCPSKVPCCPKGMPNRFSKIHGWAHLVLLLGSVFSCVLLVHSCVSISICLTRGDDILRELLKQTILWVFVAPCLYHFCVALAPWDEDLFKKPKDLHARREKLVEDTDTLSKACEKKTEEFQNGMETTKNLFNKEFDDFVVFLEKWKSKSLKKEPIEEEGKEHTEEERTRELQAFVKRWFKAFEECCWDPGVKPNVIVPNIEQKLKEAVENEQGKSTETSRAKETKVVQVNALAARRELKDKKAQDWNGRSSVCAFCKNQRERARNLRLCPDGPGEAPNVGSTSELPEILSLTLTHLPSYLQRIPWLKCKKRSSNGTQSKKLFGVPFGCATLEVQSWQHLFLLLGFCAGWVLLVLEFVIPGANRKRVSLLIVFQVIVILNLIIFSDLASLQHLEVLEKDTDQKTAEVDDWKKELDKYYERLDSLSPYWRHRVAPRLQIFRKFCEYTIEGNDDSEEEAKLTFQAFNEGIDEIDKNLGDVTLWFNNKAITLEQKKAYEEKMTFTPIGEGSDKFDEFCVWLMACSPKEALREAADAGSAFLGSYSLACPSDDQ